MVTPDIKNPGHSQLIFIDIAKDQARLGGSALAQVYGQIGNHSPDVDDPDMLKRAFHAIQKLISQNLILAGHDIRDGGLITTFLEMAFAGNCGLKIQMDGPWSPLERLFAEELGVVIECHRTDVRRVLGILDSFHLRSALIGETTEEKKILVTYHLQKVLEADMRVLREGWEETSYQIERLQMNSQCADEERKNIFDRKGLTYSIPFQPQLTPAHLLEAKDKPEVAILREEGSNGDREMTSAFNQAGFRPWDITMTDLIRGRITLERFRGLVAVGGFSYADVPESAKGWAAAIRFNERLRKMFNDFYNRPDTFTSTPVGGFTKSLELSANAANDAGAANDGLTWFYLVKVDENSRCLGCTTSGEVEMPWAGQVVRSLGGLIATQTITLSALPLLSFRPRQRWVVTTLSIIALTFAFFDIFAQVRQGLYYNIDRMTYQSSVDLVDFMLLLQMKVDAGQGLLKGVILGASVLYLSGFVWLYRRGRRRVRSEEPALLPSQDVLPS